MSEAIMKSKNELEAYLGRRSGRKRDKPVTLAPVQFGQGRIVPQEDYANYLKEHSNSTGEDEKGWNYRKIDDSTIASGPLAAEAFETYENIVQLTEIFEESFTSLGRAQDRKVSVRKQAAPLAVKPKHKGPKYTIGDATPERFGKAKAAGKQLRKEKETFDDGRPTGLERKRFIGILEVWHKRDVIDKATYTAAETFQRDNDLSLEASPRMISRYGHIMPAGVPELLPQEIQIEFEKRKRAATKAVDPRLHFILAWIAEVSNNEIHPDEVAERYWPNRQPKTRMERFKGLLEYVCMQLSVHYGQAERHRWVKLSMSKAAEEIADLLRA